MNSKVLEAYALAKEKYAKYGVDTDKVVEQFKKQEISLHCWQGDDVTGFEPQTGVASQNVVTGNYRGKATNPEQLRGDIEFVFSMSPIAHKVNLHSIYAEPARAKSRDMYTAEDFSKWIDWAKNNGLGLDYNGSFFAHEMMADNMSLASPNKQVREFWIRHAKNSREISYEMGKALNKKCVNNIWVPDGQKDVPASRLSYRSYLKESLDEILAAPYKDASKAVDVLEAKLFGIGTEAFVVGSYDFYLSYAAKNNVGICVDTGHYHPTECIADKLSSLSLFFKDILLHVSRGLHWDSDHVVIFSDETQAIMREAKRSGILNSLYIGLDYFDASINRVAAWTIGLKAAERALLLAMLEPTDIIINLEKEMNYTERLAMQEEFKQLPFSAVYDYACESKGIPVGGDWLNAFRAYDEKVISKR